MAIHRFKCSKELNEAIIQFSDKHKFDEGDLLETQFAKWLESPSIQTIVDTEKNYLLRHQYETDIEVKIFKSIKYYYIKKFLKPEEKPEEKKTRQHVVLPTELKEAIQADLHKHFQESPDFKPSDTFASFDVSGYPFPENVIKKCYKNQYYQMKHKKYVPTVDA
jgi:hypothetical protein